jgi:hypothetical protein
LLFFAFEFIDNCSPPNFFVVRCRLAVRLEVAGRIQSPQMVDLLLATLRTEVARIDGIGITSPDDILAIKVPGEPRMVLVEVRFEDGEERSDALCRSIRTTVHRTTREIIGTSKVIPRIRFGIQS